MEVSGQLHILPTPVHIEHGLNGTQRRTGPFGEEENLSLPKVEQRFLGVPTHNPVSIPTVPYFVKNHVVKYTSTKSTLSEVIAGPLYHAAMILLFTLCAGAEGVDTVMKLIYSQF
jgi:hypothetical protein